MKKILGISAAVAIAGWAGLAHAGSGCCPYAGKTTASAAKVETASKSYSCQAGFLDGIDLTEAQQSKIAALKEECKKEASCSEACWDKYITGVKSILTAEQVAQVEKSCKESGWKSPFATIKTAQAASGE